MRRVDGLLLLNKPAGMTSNEALQKVRRLLGAKKAGHTGSLDPAATGMLPLCFGEATKVCAFLLNADKTYRVTARLGTATDTGDADGARIDSADVPDLSRDEWDALLQEFVGESMQVPPMYSALKKDGKRLYELARAGKTVEREARPIRIDAISLLEAAGARLVFRVRCSKGTYIRVLVEDIARRAGTVGHTMRLHRESVADFDAERTIDLDAVVAMARQGTLEGSLLASDTALQGLSRVSIGAAAAARFREGQAVEVSAHGTPGLARVYGGDGEFVGVGEQSGDGWVTPRRVFRPPERDV